MDLTEVNQFNQIRHPWETSRFRFFERIIHKELAGCASARVLDVGSGDAWFSRQLVHCCPFIRQIDCWDIGYAKNALPGAVDGQRIRFVSERPNEKYDMIMALDVLEHVENDQDFLNSLVKENCTTGGWVLVSVPAWMSLYSDHDRFLRHFRRYNPSQIETIINRSGVKIVRSGGLFHTLILPRWIKSKLGAKNQDPGGSDLKWSGHVLVTSLFETMLLLDNEFSIITSSLGLDVPGLSWWAVCKNS